MSKVVDSVIGLAIGDAMGVPTQFHPRRWLLANPIKEMTEPIKEGQPVGAWSDDTSMTVCTIESYIEKDKFDYDDIMTKFVNWINNADYTSAGKTFDVGRTCLKAISKYMDCVSPIDCGLTDEKSNGNGSLMRILPVALYAYYKKLSDEEIINLTNDISSLTHAHEISKLGCYIYVRYVMFLLEGHTKEEAYELIKKVNYSSYAHSSIDAYNRILKDNIVKYSIDDIDSTGYVVSTLECALWILLKSKSFEETIFATTNIGNDTDTIGAIAGSMAGIIYGYDNIPIRWLDKLLRKDYLIDISKQFEDKINI